jgi:nicotinamide-nucleotide amidase
MTTASVCTIGDEILIGQIVDTNSSKIASALESLGIKVTRMTSIGDDRAQILSALRKELEDNDIVITTGGLGPTDDDITKPALAELTGSKKMVQHKGQLEKVIEILHGRGLDVLDINKAQAMVPDTCEVIVNRVGTAPIMVFRVSEKDFGHKATLYAMPGVPHETEDMLPDVLEDIKAHNDLMTIMHKNVMVYGMAESALAKKIAPWEASLPKGVHLAYLPNTLTGVRLRLSMYGGKAKADEELLEAEIGRLKGIIGDMIYSTDDDTLEHAVGKLFKERKLTLSAAESCTGGEIAHLITTVPGASEFFLGSVTSYAIPVKEKVLGVPAGVIEENGVVSSPVAAAMAEGVRKLLGSDYAVSTTGLAGPGGDERNPEGTVWIGVASRRGSKTAKFQYHNDRKRNIERFAASALYTLLNFVKSEENL